MRIHKLQLLRLFTPFLVFIYSSPCLSQVDFQIYHKGKPTGLYTDRLDTINIRFFKKVQYDKRWFGYWYFFDGYLYEHNVIYNKSLRIKRMYFSTTIPFKPYTEQGQFYLGRVGREIVYNKKGTLVKKISEYQNAE